MKRNPPTPGFDFIGSGCFASAYKDRNSNVELITENTTDSLNEKEAIKHGGVNNYDQRFNVVDMSREAMIRAREKVLAHLKKFLPEITRLRIDIRIDQRAKQTANATKHITILKMRTLAKKHNTRN